MHTTPDSQLPQPSPELAPATPPGEGERRAQRGYTRQYNSAAAAIYAALERGTLEWVGLADRGAGIADDVVLGFAGRVVGHQFKTSRFPVKFQLRTLLLGAAGLLQPLATAWQALKRSNPGQLAEIRLVTNDYPSTTDRLIELDGTHSASFLSEFDTYQGRTLGEWRATSWKPWIDELHGASGLGEQEFDVFLRSLKILYGSAADFVQAHRLTQEGARLAGEIATLLPRLVADVRDKDRWSRAELLHELGWRDSAVARHIHQFPVGAYVQRNVTTEHALRDAMRQHTCGYVSLVGPPGAGKSTLLQASLETEPGMFLVRYLAYVPGVGQRLGRAEADDFFDDVNTHLKQTGLYGSRFRDDSLHERRAQFDTLLQQAGERFARDGIRTLIVIDGLDHVPREEKPQRSFLAELPLPEAVPDGVLFVLGTQRLNLDDIKPAVQDQAGGVGRSITVTPLAREAVYRMADLLGLDESIDRDRIFDLSNGHPLVTRYLIEAIREADSATRGKLLAGSLKFDGDIEIVYESAWRSIRDDEQAREVLDYLARAEGPMPLELLVQAVPEQAIERALRATRHLLSEGRHGWTVFHNSFRLFILDKPKMRFGRPDQAYSKRVYQSLAALARVAPGDSQQRWLELRYLARAEEHSAVLALVTPERFRQQLAERRSFAELRADLRLAFTSARHCYDPVIVFQLMLIQDEVVRRWDAYEEAPSIADALLHVGDLDATVAFVEQVPDSGYKVVDALLNAGDVSRARALFDSLEPLQQLLTGTSDGHPLAVSELDEWARRVIHFRGLDQILPAIDRVSSATRLSGIEVTQEDVNALVAHLKGEVAFAIIDAGDDVDATEVGQSLGIDAATLVTVLIRVGLAATQRGANDAALARIREAFAREVFSEAPNALRRGAALIAAKNRDLSLAAEIHRSLTTPVLADLDRLTGDNASEHMARAVLEHAELTAMLGQKASTVRASDRRALRPLQFHSAAIGEVLGRARRDPASVHAGEVARVAQATLTYLGRVQADGADEFYALHQIAAATPVLGEALIQAAALCGEQEFLATIKEFDSAFAQPDSTNGSRTNLRRAVAIRIYQCTGDTDEASRRLEELVVTLVESTPAQQIEGIADLAAAFAQVGNIGRAKELLACVPKESLGYARPPKKDPQYAVWRELLRQANRIQPTNRSDRVALLVRQVAGMMQTEGRDSAYRIAQVLLEEAMLCTPSTGWLVGRRLVDDGVIGWALMVDALMLGLVRRRPDLTLVATVTWCELALPYYLEPHYNESRLGVFVAAAIEVAALEDVGEVIDTLLLAIEAEARVHERVGLLDRLCKAAKSRGIASQLMDDTRARWAAEAPRPRHSYTPMRYDDVSTLSGLKRRLEIDDLAGEVSYDAPNAFCRVVTDADYALAKEVFDRWPPIQRNSRARFVVIDLAIAAGQIDVARQLMDGYNDGDADERATWTSWSGGGLQRYFRAKIKLEGAKVYGDAYENFVGGLASGRDSASSALLEFEDIFPTLIESPDWANMWDSLAEQLTATREYAMGSAFTVDGHENLSDEELIGSLFVWALDLSIAEVHRHAVSGALRLRSTKGGSTVFALLIRRLLSGPADQPAEGIQLLLLEEEDSLASELGDEVLRLTKHADYAVAVGATILSRGWGLSPASTEEPLPFFYSLVLKDEEDFGRPQLVDAIAGPMRVEDPLGWTFHFRDQIELLSQSGISSSHIRHRCRMFIEQWGGLDTFGQKATRRLESDLRNLEMKMLYARPHIVVAARALRYVAEEMRRGGVIPDEAATELLYMMGYPASRAPIILPVPRPAFIQRPARDETRWREEEETWLNGVNDDVARLGAGTDIIFAEVCEFHILRSGRVFSMERVRAQALAADSTRLDLNAFTLLPNSIWVGYPVPTSSMPAKTIVRRVSASWNPEVPQFQLAICAHWLQRLEWFSHPSNEFVYVDKFGAIVSRMVWWRDGGPVDIDDEVIWGEGMYLNLTPVGRKQIEALTGPLKINVYSRRSCRHDLRDLEAQVRVAVSTD
ncbi:ATP-binding protein [Burkholderia ubonensis]|uniref:ATP-binding protein n=1 Tax=Burkholderia ubonensis TaxID=101571 RepID=UPI000A76DA36|nr:ATP-binding protein [Burkholderia ubonensis]